MYAAPRPFRQGTEGAPEIAILHDPIEPRAGFSALNDGSQTGRASNLHPNFVGPYRAGAVLTLLES